VEPLGEVPRLSGKALENRRTLVQRLLGENRITYQEATVYLVYVSKGHESLATFRGEGSPRSESDLATMIERVEEEVCRNGTKI